MDEKYLYGSDGNREYLQRLREDLLRFGRRFPSPGGASWYLGDDGTPWKDRPRETWITCRMAHVYSIAAILGRRAEAAGRVPSDGCPSPADCASLAATAVRGIRGELHDAVNDGWFSGIRMDGTPLPDKLCYQHAFVILAASSALLAGIEGAGELLSLALDVYDRYFWNEEEGLSADTWDMSFTQLSPYRGLNANMHTVEAFLAAADALQDEKYRARAGRIIEHVCSWARAQDWRIPEHFTQDWTPDLACSIDRPDDPFKPYGATPGHGIEWARLITQWALSAHAEPEDALPFIDAAEDLFRRAVTDAWNADGEPGLVYTTDWEGRPVVHDRMHWTLAEAINTSAVLYRVTGKESYAEWYSVFMEYLDRCVVDHVHGSWFHQLDAHNQLKGTVWPGKSDLYHAFQATLIPYLDPKVSIAAACCRRK